MNIFKQCKSLLINSSPIEIAKKNLTTSTILAVSAGGCASGVSSTEMFDNGKETLYTAASAIPLAAAIRHAGIVGMRSGVLTRSSIVQSVFGLEHRKILFKCLCIEMFTAKQINSLLSKWLDHYFKPNSNEEKAATLLKIVLSTVISTAPALRADCATINSAITCNQFTKIYGASFRFATARNLANSLSVFFNDDICKILNITRLTPEHMALTLLLGATAAPFHKALVDTVTGTPVQLLKMSKEVAYGILFRSLYPNAIVLTKSNINYALNEPFKS